jgi:hypothetical protein
LIASLLKALAPAGKRLTPMLAIVTQGWLFSLGTLAFGNTLIGCAVGAVLSSFWAFAQPLLIQYLLFGDTFFKALSAAFAKTAQAFGWESLSLVQVALGLVVLKAFFSLLAFLFAAAAPVTWISRYEQKLFAWSVARRKPAKRSMGPVRGALHDLRQPVFVMSMLASLVFFAFDGASHAQLVVYALRPLALGFLIYYFVRAVPLERLTQKLETWGAPKLARAVRRSAESVGARTRRAYVGPSHDDKLSS